MKILIDGLPDTIGGIGSLIMNLVCSSLDNPLHCNVQFSFLVYSESEYIRLIEKLHLRYFITPRFGTEYFRYCQFLKKHFKNNTYDYLWINNTSKINYKLPYYAKKYSHAKIIIHSHGCNIEEQGLKGKIFNLINWLNYRKFMNISDIKIACSHASADFFYQKGTQYREQVHIINNGIFLTQYVFNHHLRVKYREELGLKCDDIALVMVGRLTAVKNQTFSISLIPELEERYKLFIFGDGELKNKLISQIKNLNIDNQVFIMGQKENIGEYLNAMDIYLMPSLHEGMPFSIIEAQASGLNCIISNSLSKELNITDSVQYANIDTKEEWIQCIVNHTYSENRENCGKVIMEKGYSIEESVNNFFDLLKEG